MAKYPLLERARATLPVGWLGRVALSLAIALLAGALAFLLSRAAGNVLLFLRQQEMLREVAGALQGGIEGLGASNLREVRQRLQAIDARNEQISLLIGFAAAGLAAVASYLWLERRSGERTPMRR
jgi:hypothetical protein